VTFATRGVDDRNWSVRAAAYAVLARVRRVDSIPLLIGRLGRETGRLREDALDALEALTRMRFHETARWEQWWAESRISFEMPPAPETAKDAPRTRRAAPTTVSYYDLPMTSTRAVFVVDTSGSMSAPIGTGGTTRLEESKRQLRRVLDSIPDTFMVNIVPFGSTANPFAAVLQKATKAVKADFTERIVALTPAGGTNLHAGLTTAFADDTIDTVYVLSDGSPSAGEITDPTELADEVQRWNRTRRVKIHCIAVGQDSPFLRRLATDSGGEYTHVR
jgi:Mg-chelatase subunit ChlD